MPKVEIKQPIIDEIKKHAENAAAQDAMNRLSPEEE